MRNNIWNKRLPRGLGLIMLFFSLATIFWLSRNAVILVTKATVGNIPKSVQISNITNNSFTISYITDEAVAGSIAYGKDSKLGGVALDDRDLNAPAPHRVHHITLKNISPATQYFYSIISGAKTFQNGTAPYETTTASGSAAKSEPAWPIAGKVTFEDGSIPTEAIAYVSSGDSQVLSAALLPDGGYAFTLDKILKKDLSGPVKIASNTALRLHIVSPTFQSRVTFLASQATPVPPIILSKNYDFSISTESLSTPSATESAQISGFPISDDISSSTEPQIITPKTEQEFKDQQPLFQGKALPGNDVEITIQSEHEITATVQADEKGNWEYRPTTTDCPGEHTLTIKTLDVEGVIKTLTQPFTVYAEGSQFVEPSVSPTVSPTPTIQLTPTVAPTVSPTASPSAVPTPVVIITTPITSTASATPVPNITTPEIPASGSSALMLGVIGAILSIGIGGLIFLLL